MGRKLKSAPLYFVLAQVRFDVLLQLDTFLPAIQEGMRRAGYPLFTTTKTFTVDVTVGEPTDGSVASAMPQTKIVEQYLFTDIAQTRGFMLGQDSLTLQATVYEDFDDYAGAFLRGLTLVHEAVNLTVTERIGLRYLNHVFPRDGERLQDYLEPEACGMGTHLLGAVHHLYTEALMMSGDIGLRLRTMLQFGPLAFPPDISTHTLKVQPRFLELNGPNAIVDIDGSTQQREPFSLDSVNARLSSIHTHTDIAFEATMLPHALKVWNT